ncbi:MAG: hypothetical protein IJH31_02615 [Erysipelotrichaceae bacterium]|nr:hypothetical protein [Erysipelotrichaceae bacterium]
MENSNLLISVAVLQKYWESGNKDTLDLLMPFLKTTISKTVKLNEQIDVELLSMKFKEDYGYESMPINILYSMLKRLSPEFLTINHKQYYLTSSLDNDVIKFEKRKKESKEHYELVIHTLKSYLNEELQKNELSDSDVSKHLYNFFVQHGLCFTKNIDDLIAISKKNNKIAYHIAEFIYNEYKKDSCIFSYILEMVQGFFVSTALSIDEANTSTNAKLNGLSCYIDTRIIIDALGYHLPKITMDSAREFLNMLKESGAKLICFEHNFEEIKNVLYAYKNSFSNMSANYVNTLEALDESGYTVSDVERIISRLQFLIEDLGIEIVKTPVYEKGEIDLSDLERQLKEEVIYKKTNSVFVDIASIKSILSLRKDKVADSLEKSKHVFISSNYRYCLAAQHFILENTKEKVPAIYYEKEFASLMWLRNYSTHKDYPKSKLIENAMAVLEVPTQSFMNDLFSIIDKIEQEGGITNEEAAVIRTDYFSKKTIYMQCKGDPSDISDQTVLSIKEDLKKRYSKEATEKSTINYQKFVEQRSINNERKSKAIRIILETGEKTKNKVSKTLTVCFAVIALLILILGLYSIIKSATKNEIDYLVVTICVIDVVGYISQIRSYESLVNKTIRKVSKNMSDKAMDRKREEYKEIFGDLQN